MKGVSKSFAEIRSGTTSEVKLGRQQTLGSLVLGSLASCAFLGILAYSQQAGFKRARVKNRVLA